MLVPACPPDPRLVINPGTILAINSRRTMEETGSATLWLNAGSRRGAVLTDGDWGPFVNAPNTRARTILSAPVSLVTPIWDR